MKLNRVCMCVCVYTCVSLRVFTSQSIQVIYQYFTSESMIFSSLIFDLSQSSLIGERYQPSLYLSRGRQLGAVLDASLLPLNASILSSFELSNL